MTRTAIAYASITLHVKEYEEDGVTRIDIQQIATGGIQGTTEERKLDWSEREHSDHIFGNVVGQSRFLPPDSELIEDPWLKEDWLPEGEVVESLAINKEAGWTALQIWGFAEVDGQRYYTRRVRASKGDEVVRVRLYYDWLGKDE